MDKGDCQNDINSIYMNKNLKNSDHKYLKLMCCLYF